MNKNNNDEIEMLDFEDDKPSLEETVEMLDFASDLKVSKQIDEMLDFIDFEDDKSQEKTQILDIINDDKEDNVAIKLDINKGKLNEYVPSIKDFNIKSAKVRKIVYKSMLYVVILMLVGFEFFINKSGDMLNELRVYASNNQPIRIVQNEKYGYIDSLGKKIVNPKYVYADNFIKGYAIVKNSSNLPLIIDKGGKEAIASGMYFSIYRASNDIIASKITKKGLKYGILNEDLKKKTDFIYDSISYKNGVFTYTNSNEVGIINSDGKDIYKYKLTDLDNKKISVNKSILNDTSYDAYGVVTVNSTSVIINLNTGKEVSNPTLNEIVPEENNVFYEKLPNGNKRYFYVQDDNIILESDDYISLSISSLKSGVLKAIDSKQNYLFISVKTKEQLKKDLRVEDVFEGDTAFIYNSYNYKKNKNDIIIVKNGEVFKTINGDFSIYKGFVNDVAIVKFIDGTYGYIDSNGNFISNDNYIEALEFDSYGQAIAKKEEGYGVLNKDGKTIVNFENKDVKMATSLVKQNTLADSNNIFFAVKKDNKYALYNSKGKKVNKEYYDDVTFNDTYGIVKISTDIKDALILSKTLAEINLVSDKMNYDAYENYIIIKNDYYNYDGKLIYVDYSKGENDNG